MVKYDENKKHAYFNGITFTRDDKTGYYLSTKIVKDDKRQRLHAYVWEYYNGDIAEGYEVHHKDEDKSNNQISNFIILLGLKHRKLHIDEHLKDDNWLAQARENMIKNVIPKAKEWHKSEKGSEWHKKHYEKCKDKLYEKKEYKCKNCEKPFMSIREGFCSNNCKSMWRRKQGLDDESRTCIICGKQFTVNKYSKTQSCSFKCRGEVRCLNKQKSEV